MGRRFRRFPRRWNASLVLVVALVLLWQWYHGPPQAPPKSLAEGDYQVQRVVDGDTLVLANGARVRLLGVDTPETVKPNTPVQPWGSEASAFAKAFVAGGTVRLTFDSERTDKYDRFLAYVWVGDRMLNEELLRAGLGKALLQYPYSSAMKRRFRQAEAEAKQARRGMWSGKE
jgi:micrococcal nuclease